MIILSHVHYDFAGMPNFAWQKNAGIPLFCRQQEPKCQGKGLQKPLVVQYGKPFPLVVRLVTSWKYNKGFEKGLPL